MTAYKAGDVQLSNLQMTDGVEVLDLGSIQYKATSVLPPPEPGQPEVKTESYGPVGPATLGIPVVYWAFLAAFWDWYFCC